ncbi:MAG: N-acetylmuramoyl-L-alanine amidase [Deltaproteobacteria bacterium]|nr:N-acetylmuramoyl-L-alanine amidase [Deltaproteobacteria bacterium]
MLGFVFAQTLLAVLPAVATPQLLIVDKPLAFGPRRLELTRDYIRRHYGREVSAITIVPRVVVVHWTATPTLSGAFSRFNRVELDRRRLRLHRAGRVNVSAQFLVDRDGTVYRLMPETWMARHCIGLNLDAIGIENIGGGAKWPLTKAQLRANAQLVRYLAGKYSTLKFLIGHFEWRNLRRAPFFRERDPNYRSSKADPGKPFIGALRRQLADLKLASHYPPSVSPPRSRTGR